MTISGIPTRCFPALALLLVFTAAGARAGVSPAGTWKLNLGLKAPCELAIAEDGTLTPAPDCALGTSLARWKSTSDGIQLQTASGETYAVLKLKDAQYEGITIADMRKLILSH